PGPRPQPGPVQPSPAAKLFKAKKGYANYYFNELEKKRLLEAFKKHGDFSDAGGAWTITADARLAPEGTAEDAATLRMTEVKETGEKAGRTVVESRIGNSDDSLGPLRGGLNTADYKAPEGSGGLLAALYVYPLFLTQGEKAFEGQFAHGGVEPI